jgi:hypothetical protein
MMLPKLNEALAKLLIPLRIAQRDVDSKYVDPMCVAVVTGAWLIARAMILCSPHAMMREDQALEKTE